MSAYMITYFISDTCGCGCGDHDHDHAHEHNHEHVESSENNIIAKIKSLGAWAHFMPEGYIVKSSSTAQEILEEFNSVANTGDIIFVTKVDADSCACKTQAVIDWIAQ